MDKQNLLLIAILAVIVAAIGLVVFFYSSPDAAQGRFLNTERFYSNDDTQIYSERYLTGSQPDTERYFDDQSPEIIGDLAANKLIAFSDKICNDTECKNISDIGALLTEVDWTDLTNYPVGCAANEAVHRIGDTLTCISLPSPTGSCDGNADCVLTGRLNSNFDANVVDLNADDITTSGDITIKANNCLYLYDTPSTSLCQTGGSFVVTGGGASPIIRMDSTFQDATLPSVHSVGQASARWSAGYFNYIDINGEVNSKSLDVISGNTTSSSVHIGEAANEGGWLTSLTAQQLIVSAGSEYLNGSWVGRDYGSSLYSIDAGGIYFYVDDDTEPNVTYTPTERVNINSSGLNSTGGINATGGFSVGSYAGIDKNIHLTDESCDLNFKGGILYASDC